VNDEPKIECMVIELLRPGDGRTPVGPLAVRSLLGAVTFRALPRSGEFISYDNRHFQVAAVVHPTSQAPYVDVYAMEVRDGEGKTIEGDTDFVQWLFDGRPHPSSADVLHGVTAAIDAPGAERG
jgi:hypothetical protein